MPGRSAAERQATHARGSVTRAGARPSARGGWDALLARGNRRLLRALAIRAKSRVVAAADPREREADDIAKRVVAGDTIAGVAGRTASGDVVQRRCAACAAAGASCADCEEEDELLLKRRGDGGGDGAAPAAMLDALGGGHPLDDATRAFMEPRLGASLDDVRIHVGGESDDAAGALGARAFTTGRDVVFARGEYDPRGDAGRELLAHELVHVLQQRAGSVARPAVQRQEQHGTDAMDAGVSYGGDAGVSDAGVPYAVSLPGGTPYIGYSDTSVGDSADEQPEHGTLTDVFDPCAVDEASLTNQELMVHWERVRSYLALLDGSHMHGEARYWDYANLGRRLATQRESRARAGHMWLNEDVRGVPATLYRISEGLIPSTLVVDRADAGAEAGNGSTNGAIVVTPQQFTRMLDRLGIPRISPEEYFARQTAAAASPMVLGVPQAGASTPMSHGLDRLAVGGFLAPPPQAMSSMLPSMGFGFGVAGSIPVSPQTMYAWPAFTQPVVTGGPQAYAADQVGGFRVRWQGAMGEGLYGGASIDPRTLRPNLFDLNFAQPNAPGFDFLSRVAPEYTQLKTQLPNTVGGAPSLESVQEACRILFAGENPALRAQALALLQSQGNPTLTMEAMLRGARIAVNPETVAPAQDSLATGVRRAPGDYAPLLNALLEVQGVTVRMRNGTDVTYTDFATLEAARPNMTQARYRAAINELAIRSRGQIVSSGISAETLRSLIEYRQQYDFRGASDFTGLSPADTRTLQESYFERMATPELMQMQLRGLPSVLGRPAMTGAGLGLATSAIFGGYHMLDTWGTDPYAGRRFMLNLGVGGAGGVITVTGDQLIRMGISQGSLSTAEFLAGRGMSIAPVSRLAPAARFGGSTAWGGVSAAGLAVGGMYLDETFFGADYAPSQYMGAAVRYGAGGTVAAVTTAGVGAGATAIAVAVVSAEGAGAACTPFFPVVGTITCGGVGAIVGFVGGLGAFLIFDSKVGDEIQAAVQGPLERGCGGH